MPQEPTYRGRGSVAPWILPLSVVPILAATGWALLAFARHPDNEGWAARQALLRMGPVMERALADRGEGLSRLGTMIARDPKFFAVLTLPRSDRGADFRRALEAVLRDFQRDAGVRLFAVTDPEGSLLARGATPTGEAVDISRAPFIRQAIQGETGAGYVVEKGALYQVAAVPVSAGGVLVGVLCLGNPLDGDLGAWIKSATECDVAFLSGGSISASTLPPSPLRKELSRRVEEGGKLGSAGVEQLSADGHSFLVLRRTLQGPAQGDGAPGYLLVRPLLLETSPLMIFRRDLFHALALGFSLSILCGGILALAVHLAGRRAARAHTMKLDSVASARSRLLANAAEEILEPSSTAETMADLIFDGALGDLSQPQREGLMAIRVAANALSRVGRNLESLVSGDRGDLTFEFAESDVAAIVELAAIEIVPLASSRGQTISFSSEPNLHHPRVDPVRLAAAVRNMVHHVVRSGSEGSPVHVVARRAPVGITILASISGEGTNTPSTGSPPVEVEDHLALTVASRIAVGHGGSLRAWLEPSSGATVVLELPLAAAPSEEQMEQRTPPEQENLALVSY
jgi:signal transduction histidine kinase